MRLLRIATRSLQNISRSALLIAACLITIFTMLASGATPASKHSQAKADAPQHTAAKPAAPKQTAKPNTPAQSTTNHPDTSAGNTAASDAAVAAAGTGPATVACKLLTADVASQALGGTAQQSTASDTSSLQASDTSVTTCAYTGANGSTQLTIRAATGSLGASENATAFGSGRPANAVPVASYGQSAYWDPTAHQLNILGHNNWYVITRSTSTQADTEAVAKLLAPGF